MKKTWLFIDFDNTLMATEQYAVPSLIARFNALYGNKIDHLLTYEEFKRHFHGQARASLCQQLSHHFSITVDYPLLYDQREYRIMQHYQELPEGIPMAPHIIEVLTQLSEQAVQLAVVSNNPVQRALAAMRFAQNKQGALLARFFGTHFFEAGDTPKPRPDVYLHAIQQLNAAVENSFAIEDSLTGARSAMAAGLKTLGYTGLADPSEQAALKSALLDAGCVATFSDWRECPALLSSSSSSAATHTC